MQSDDGANQQTIVVGGPYPEECTTNLCSGTPKWGVRFGDDVSRRRADPHPELPPSDGVCPYVCDDCRRDHYASIDSDQWVRVLRAENGHTEPRGDDT
jgi:hypothetical protein